MNIVFWGEEQKCGTTAHMLAVSAALAMLRPRAGVSIGTPKKGERAAYRFYDQGARRDDRTRRMLLRADMAFITLRRERDCIDRFFGQDLRGVMEPYFLLGSVQGGLCGGQDAGREYLERVYRVDSGRIYDVSYNNGFCQAMGLGRGAAYVRRELGRPTSAESERFAREVAGVAMQIVRRAELRRDERRRQGARGARPQGAQSAKSVVATARGRVG